MYIRKESFLCTNGDTNDVIKRRMVKLNQLKYLGLEF